MESDVGYAVSGFWASRAEYCVCTAHLGYFRLDVSENHEEVIT